MLWGSFGVHCFVQLYQEGPFWSFIPSTLFHFPITYSLCHNTLIIRSPEKNVALLLI